MPMAASATFSATKPAAFTAQAQQRLICQCKMTVCKDRKHFTIVTAIGLAGVAWEFLQFCFSTESSARFGSEDRDFGNAKNYFGNAENVFGDAENCFRDA